MPVDNELYNGPGDIWWNDNQPLAAIRTALNPGRLAYFREVFQRLAYDPAGKRTLDVGCGGGLLAEEFARLGCEVTGVDRSAASIETAKAHATAAGLTIMYQPSQAEILPFGDGAFDLVYCCDVLEHVEDVDRVISEIARVLRPDGLFLYDTINRTMPSKLVYIKLFQEWKWSSWMPANLHDWQHFIKPSELIATMARHELANQGVRGLTPVLNPPRLIGLLRERKRTAMSFSEFGRRAAHVPTADLSIVYAGYAIRKGPASA